MGTESNAGSGSAESRDIDRWAANFESGLSEEQMARLDLVIGAYSGMLAGTTDDTDRDPVFIERKAHAVVLTHVWQRVQEISDLLRESNGVGTVEAAAEAVFKGLFLGGSDTRLEIVPGGGAK